MKSPLQLTLINVQSKYRVFSLRHYETLDKILKLLPRLFSLNSIVRKTDISYIMLILPDHSILVLLN